MVTIDMTTDDDELAFNVMNALRFLPIADMGDVHLFREPKKNGHLHIITSIATGEATKNPLIPPTEKDVAGRGHLIDTLSSVADNPGLQILAKHAAAARAEARRQRR
jgi:hypothetical protein